MPARSCETDTDISGDGVAFAFPPHPGGPAGLQHRVGEAVAPEGAGCYPLNRLAESEVAIAEVVRGISQILLIRFAPP